MVMMFIKLSICIFLLRIASQRVYIWILRISLVVVFIWSTVIFFWNLFQCNPVEKQWDWRIVKGDCVEPEALVSAAYALSAMTIVSDFLYVSHERADHGSYITDVASRLCYQYPCSGR